MVAGRVDGFGSLGGGSWTAAASWCTAGDANENIRFFFFFFSQIFLMKSGSEQRLGRFLVGMAGGRVSVVCVCVCQCVCVPAGE